MIQTRNFWTIMLLSLVTCGIYGIYAMYMYIQDLNKVCAGDGQNDMNFVTIILLSVVTFGIYGIYTIYCIGNRLNNNAPRYGQSFQENGTTLLLWYILGSFILFGSWVAIYIMIKNMNALGEAYNAHAQG